MARLRVHTRLGHAVSVLLVFRGPCRALQDLCARDWSAIYRNRIPPYLTLPLAHLLLASPQPLQVTPSSSFLPSLLAVRLAVPFPSFHLSLTSLPLLFHQTTFLVAFIHPFVILTLSLFIDLPTIHPSFSLSRCFFSFFFSLSVFFSQRTSRTKGVGVPKRRCTSSGTGGPTPRALVLPAITRSGEAAPFT